MFNLLDVPDGDVLGTLGMWDPIPKQLNQITCD